MGLAAQFEKLREISYTQIGSKTNWLRVGLPSVNPIRLIFIDSELDAPVYISFNLEIGEQFRIPAHGYKAIDITANDAQGEPIAVRENTQFWLKVVSATPSLGHVAISAMYVEPY